ncbi:MAG: GGDEF domain-containing protein, partial [Spirochaetales bacterium]|nr:GGDEF domain-containing protein [Spirochaetales bacterium]
CIAIYALYWLVRMSRAWFLKDSLSAVTLLGGIVLISTTLNDILFYSFSETFGQLVPLDLISLGLFFFVLTHSFEFSFRYLKALQITQELTEELEQKVVNRTQELHILNRRLMTMATTDELTGLGNRNELQQQAERESSEYKGGGFSVLYMDLDNFKFYNDTFSHAAGDMVLKNFAQLLTSLYSSSLANKKRVYRLGGDEFVIFLPGLNQHKAEELAGVILGELPKLNRNIQNEITDYTSSPINISEKHFITCSIGIASHTEGSLNIDALIRQADKGLLTAKGEGKNRFVTISKALIK